MRSIKLIILMGLMFLSACIDPFVPETIRYADMLFIECLLSDNEPGAGELRISYAAPLRTEDLVNQSPRPKPVSDALATLVSDDGHETPFHLVALGVYQLPADFALVSGINYHLRITIGDHSFVSEEQTLLDPAPIDSISYAAENARITESGEILYGYRFFVSTSEPGPVPRHYRWSLEATFQYSVPYVATHTWNGQETQLATNNEVITCWKTKSIPGVFVASTEGLLENRIYSAPLNMEFQYGDELTTRYSLRVTQHTIHPSSFKFWNDVNVLINQTGGLYQSQPFRVQGNIWCSNNPELFVAGIFEIGATSEARFFVDRPVEFPVYPMKCYQDTVGTVDYPWYRVPLGAYLTLDAASGRYLISRPQCYDCRERGGTNIKPSFWETLVANQTP